MITIAHAARALAGALLVLSFVGIARSAEPADLAGTWTAYPQVREQTGELVIYIEPGENASLNAGLELPQIESRRIALGEVLLDGNTIRIGPLELEMNADATELSGLLPDAMIPGHKVQAVFRKKPGAVKKSPPRDLGPSREPAWQFDTKAAIWGGLLAADDALFFGNDNGELFALDATTGALRWKLGIGGIIRSTPGEAGKDILVHADDGYLYRIDKRDGSQIWKTSLARDEPRPVSRESDDYIYDHYASSVNVANGVGYVGTYDGDIVCIDLGSGSIVWRFATGGPVLGEPAVSGDMVIGASMDEHVYALNAETGQLIWRVNAGGSVVSSPATHKDSTVFVGTRSYDLIALDLRNGERRWDYYYWFSWVESPPLVIGDTVIASGSDGGAILAFDARDGTLLWKFDSTGSIWAPLAHDETSVYVGAVGVKEYVVAHEPGFFAVDLASGDPVWRYLPAAISVDGGPRSGFAAAPAIGPALVYVGSLDGNLYAFPRDSGKDAVDVTSTASPQSSSPDADPDY